MEQNRGSWNSNLMFLLAAIGSAIGLGNLWGFPYKMGANGGLPFLIIYLIMVVLCGVVVMGVEMAIGRKTGKSPIMAMAAIGKEYKFVGWFGFLSAFIIMGFYSVILSYSFRYFFGYLINIIGMDGFSGYQTGADMFVNFSLDVPSVIGYTALTFASCAAFVMFGTEGLEKFNKIGIPALFVLLFVIIVYNFTLPGWQQGYAFMFTTEGMEMAGTKFNLLSAIRTAGGQMLFSLSLGMGAMITYGSYLDKKESIAKNAWIIPVFDTLAALMAGLAIFPAVFATGNKPGAGPGLLFMTMFDVFKTMGGIGNVLGAIFSLTVIFAGVSSAISLMEVCTSCVVDRAIAKGKTPNRKAYTLLISFGMFILAIPTCLDAFGIPGEEGIFWPITRLLGEGCQDWVDVYDVITEGFMMPVGAALMCIAVGYKAKFKWMADEVLADGKEWKAQKFFEVCVKYVTPALMLFVAVSLFLSYFGL